MMALKLNIVVNLSMLTLNDSQLPMELSDECCVMIIPTRTPGLDFNHPLRLLKDNATNIQLNETVV